jgi:RNA-binding protein
VGTKQLAGYQRKHLRGLAHSLKPLVQVGEAGLSAAVIAATQQALKDHELVKIRLHEPTDKRAMADELARQSKSQLCGLVGHTVILYRRHPETPKVEVPQR